MGRKPKETNVENPIVEENIESPIVEGNIETPAPEDNVENKENLNPQTTDEVPQFVKDAFKVFPEYKELYLTKFGIYTSPYGDAKLYRNPFIN